MLVVGVPLLEATCRAISSQDIHAFSSAILMLETFATVQHFQHV
jgi:hypothetical protein